MSRKVITVTGVILQFDAHPKVSVKDDVELTVGDINEMLRQQMPHFQPQLIAMREDINIETRIES